MLLVHDDQPQARAPGRRPRCAHRAPRRPRPSRTRRCSSGPLGRGERRVPHRDARPEPRPQPPAAAGASARSRAPARCSRAPRPCRLDRVEVDLGLARAGHPVQQQARRPPPRAMPRSRATAAACCRRSAAARSDGGPDGLGAPSRSAVSRQRPVAVHRAQRRHRGAPRAARARPRAASARRGERGDDLRAAGGRRPRPAPGEPGGAAPRAAPLGGGARTHDPPGRPAQGAPAARRQHEPQAGGRPGRGSSGDSTPPGRPGRPASAARLDDAGHRHQPPLVGRRPAAHHDPEHAPRPERAGHERAGHRGPGQLVRDRVVEHPVEAAGGHEREDPGGGRARGGSRGRRERVDGRGARAQRRRQAVAARRPAASRPMSVLSQVNSGSVRPKWPYAAVFW